MRHALGVVGGVGQALIGVGFLLLVLLLIAIRGPVIEARLLPVWNSMTIEWEPLGATGGKLAGHVYGHKARGECRLQEIVAMVRQGRYWSRSDILINGRTPGTATRPEGWQTLGLWQFSEAGDRLRMTAHYQCHELWQTPATLGEWATPIKGDPS